MTPTQSRMARAALHWTVSDLADAAGIGRATVARFELGNNVEAAKVDAMREAFEAKRVHFVDKGKMAGAVYLGLRPAP